MGHGLDRRQLGGGRAGRLMARRVMWRWRRPTACSAQATLTVEALRLAHRPDLGCWCLRCGVAWPCDSRLSLDETSVGARQQHAAWVHADWLAGTRTGARL